MLCQMFGNASARAMKVLRLSDRHARLGRLCAYPHVSNCDIAGHTMPRSLIGAPMGDGSSSNLRMLSINRACTPFVSMRSATPLISAQGCDSRLIQSSAIGTGRSFRSRRMARVNQRPFHCRWIAFSIPVEKARTSADSAVSRCSSMAATRGST